MSIKTEQAIYYFIFGVLIATAFAGAVMMYQGFTDKIEMTQAQFVWSLIAIISPKFYHDVIIPDRVKKHV
jgi:hypothetical protein